MFVTFKLMLHFSRSEKQMDADPAPTPSPAIIASAWRSNYKYKYTNKRKYTWPEHSNTTANTLGCKYLARHHSISLKDALSESNLSQFRKKDKIQNHKFLFWTQIKIWGGPFECLQYFTLLCQRWSDCKCPRRTFAGAPLRQSTNFDHWIDSEFGFNWK